MGFMAAIGAALLAITPADRATATEAYAAGLTQGRELRFLWQPAGAMDSDVTAAIMSQCVASSRVALIDGTVPERIEGTSMIAIDLNALGWRVEDWEAVCGFEYASVDAKGVRKVLHRNGYTSKANPLIVPAGWFLNEIADGRESDGYFRFLFQGKVPKTEDEFLAAIGIDRKAQGGLQFGQVEGKSGVNITEDGARLIEHSDGTNVEAWITYDVRKVSPGSDPLEGLFAGAFKHDASELYGLIPKVSAATGVRGVMPVTALGDGAGKIQAFAPPEIVPDKVNTFGDGIIANPGSCVACHVKGSQRPTLNLLRKDLASGVQIPYVDQTKRIKAELFHLGSMTEALDRWDAGYAAAMKAINGLTPEENAAAFAAAIQKQLADLDLAQAAAELSCEPEELRLALGYASSRRIELNLRVARLAHGGKIGRDTFESQYLVLQSYLDQWRAAQ